MSIDALIGLITAIIILFAAIIGVIFNDRRRKFISFNINNLCGITSISKYFESDVVANCDIDILFFPLRLRKSLPITDWLYFEYIKYLNIYCNKIKELVIFPCVDLFIPTQSTSDLVMFTENIRKIFEGSGLSYYIVNPYEDNYFVKEDLLTIDFINALKFICSSDFFTYLNGNFSVKVNSISDFNKFHMSNEKIKDIFIHIYKSLSIINYIKKKKIEFNKNINISIIFWEWEVEKLGIIKYYLNKENNVNLSSFLGITQMLDKIKPIPDIEDKTICIFDEEKIIINKAILFMPFLKKYNSILLSVNKIYNKNVKIKDLIIDGEKNWKQFKTNNNTPEINNIVIKQKKDFFLFFGLIFYFRKMYDNT